MSNPSTIEANPTWRNKLGFVTEKSVRPSSQFFALCLNTKVQMGRSRPNIYYIIKIKRMMNAVHNSHGMPLRLELFHRLFRKLTYPEYNFIMVQEGFFLRCMTKFQEFSSYIFQHPQFWHYRVKLPGLFYRLHCNSILSKAT